jgi:hypothetical protein
MQSLVFVCPHTRRTIDSGISTNRQSLSTVQDLELQLKCPHCAGRHIFPIKNGHLAQTQCDDVPLHELCGGLMASRFAAG